MKKETLQQMSQKQKGLQRTIRVMICKQIG